MRYEFDTIEERNSFIERAYKEGLKYIYHEPRYDKPIPDGFKYVVETVEE